MFSIKKRLSLVLALCLVIITIISSIGFATSNNNDEYKKVVEQYVRTFLQKGYSPYYKIN